MPSPWRKRRYRTINARCEGIENKPAFREAFKKRRCLIPADGFYDWTGPKGDRQPYRIVPKGGGIFAFAGLWERWKPNEVLANATIRRLGSERAMPAVMLSCAATTYGGVSLFGFKDMDDRVRFFRPREAYVAG